MSRRRIPSGWAASAVRYGRQLRQEAERRHAEAKAAHFEDPPSDPAAAEDSREGPQDTTAQASAPDRN